MYKRQSLASLYKYFIAIGLLVVFKGICNMVADMKKHSAGFDIVQQIRERMIIKLKKFSLGFYTNERLGEINTILHKDVDNMSLVVGHMWSRTVSYTHLSYFKIICSNNVNDIIKLDK